jgi:hypothetical protein
MDFVQGEELAAALRFILPELPALRRTRSLTACWQAWAEVNNSSNFGRCHADLAATVGKQIGIGAVVLFDGGLEHVKASFFFPGMRKRP